MKIRYCLLCICWIIVILDIISPQYHITGAFEIYGYPSTFLGLAQYLFNPETKEMYFRGLTTSGYLCLICLSIITIGLISKERSTNG